MTNPTTPTGKAAAQDSNLDYFTFEVIYAIEAEARAQERERLRAEWDRICSASEWPFDAVAFVAAFAKVLAGPEDNE